MEEKIFTTYLKSDTPRKELDTQMMKPDCYCGKKKIKWGEDNKNNPNL